MLNNDFYYFSTMRKLVVAFGSLFNNIAVVRYDNTRTIELERFLVPIMYGQKEKWLMRLTQSPDLQRYIEVALPRMSFEMGSPMYDPNRKQNSMISFRAPIAGSQDNLTQQYIGVPYNIPFTLSIYVRNIEDGAQIMEQIIPVFKPDYNLKIQYDQTMNTVIDTPIILEGIQYEVDNEGSPDDARVITWTLNFKIKSYFFCPRETTGIILNTTTRFFNISTAILSEQALNMNPGGFGTFQASEIVFQGSSLSSANVTGTVVYWDPSNRKLYVDQVLDENNNLAFFNLDQPVIGANTNAQWVVNSYYTANSLPVVVSTIYPVPNTANANSDFGYDVSIYEFPNTTNFMTP